MPRSRRSKAEMETIKRWILHLCDKYRPMTVRQLFYALVINGIIEKTEAEYKQLVCRLTKDLRLSGELPWEWLVDNTRWMHKPRTYAGLHDLLAQGARSYRRALWDPATNSNYCEIWLEKDALTGVLYDVTSEFDVPLMPCRGYPSLSFLRQGAESIAQEIMARGGEGGWGTAHIYYFGDYDPTGVDISRNIEVRLRQFVFEILANAYGEDSEEWVYHAVARHLLFARVAVNQDQIASMGLPTRPTKRSDPRAAAHGDESVELDAILPDQLRQMVRECLERHVDPVQLEDLARTEEFERQTLLDMAVKLAA